MSQTFQRTVRTRPIQLSGDDVYESLYTTESTTNIRAMRVIYDESTSADAGVEIRIGKIGFANKFATFTTESSKSAGEFTWLPKTSNSLAAGETLTVECDGGKTGDGVASVQIELTHDLTL